VPHAYGVLVGYQKGKNPLGRPKCRLVVNMKLDIREDGVVKTGTICPRIGTGGGLM
jgi:hypothetical protein